MCRRVCALFQSNRLNSRLLTLFDVIRCFAIVPDDSGCSIIYRELESFVTPTMKAELVKFYSEVKPDNVEKVK